MAEKKMPIGTFIVELESALNRKDGYIMCATGQNPKKWSKTSWWFTQYSGSKKTKALYWRENAQRVWDCNGLAEGIYKDWSGDDINTKARHNYANWCATKGSGMIPNQYKVPGAAVFWGDKASDITHVAYLYKPVDSNNPTGDWYLIEARGVMYGVVQTKLNSRKPNFWGLMTKYFDYENLNFEPISLGDRLLKNGSIGDDVKELQTLLTRLGYLNDTIDGEFGKNTEAAVKAFQKANGLEVDGEYGEKSHLALMKIVDEEEKQEDPVPEQETEPEQGNILLEVTGNSVRVRAGDSTDYSILDTMKKGSNLISILGKDKKPIISQNGWYAVEQEKQIGWISGKYIKVV